MTIVTEAVAGSMESSDIMITLAPWEGEGYEIELKSIVDKQFGRSIRKVISQTLQELGIESARVVAVDLGALDCAVRARVKTAAFRACQRQDYNWEGENR